MKRHLKSTATLILAVCALAAAQTAFSQAYPSKPIRWILPFAPGGGLDILSRAVQPQLQANLGQPLVMDNRPSNSGIVASEAVARSAPDGYTIMTAGNSDLVFNKIIRKNLPYDPERDFAPVILLARAPIALFVHESVPAKSLKEFIAHLKAQPGKLNYGSAGVGHPFHLAMELLLQRTGTQATHIPYKGSALVIQDIVAGRLHALFYPATGQVVALVKDGKLRALASAYEKRLPALPDTPSFGEAGVPNFNAAGWFSVVAPAGTPRPIIDRLNAEIRKVGHSPELARVYAKLSMLPGLGSPGELAQLMKDDFATWTPLIKALNITIE